MRRPSILLLTLSNFCAICVAFHIPPPPAVSPHLKTHSLAGRGVRARRLKGGVLRAAKDRADAQVRDPDPAQDGLEAEREALERIRKEVEEARRALTSLKGELFAANPLQSGGDDQDQEAKARSGRAKEYWEDVVGAGPWIADAELRQVTMSDYLKSIIRKLGWGEHVVARGDYEFLCGLLGAKERSDYEEETLGAKMLGDGGKAGFFTVENLMKKSSDADGTEDYLSTVTANDDDGLIQDPFKALREAEGVGLFVGGGLQRGERVGKEDIYPHEWLILHQEEAWDAAAVSEDVVASVLSSAVAWGVEEARIMLGCTLELKARARNLSAEPLEQQSKDQQQTEGEEQSGKHTPTSAEAGMPPTEVERELEMSAITSGMRLAAAQAFAAFMIVSQQPRSALEGKSGTQVAEEALEAARLWPSLHVDVLPSLGLTDAEYTPLSPADICLLREKVLSPDLWLPGLDPRTEGLDQFSRLPPTGRAGDVLPINGVALFRGRFKKNSVEAMMEEVRKRASEAGLDDRMQLVLWRELPTGQQLVGAAALQANLEEDEMMDQVAISISQDTSGEALNVQEIGELFFPGNKFVIVALPADAAPASPGDRALLTNSVALLTSAMFLNGASGLTADDSTWVFFGTLLVQIAHELAHVAAAKHHGVGLQFPIFMPSIPLGFSGTAQRLKGWPKDGEGMFDIPASGIAVGSLLSLAMLVGGLALTAQGEGALVQVPDGLVESSLLGGTLVDLWLPGFRGAGDFVPMHPLAGAGLVALRAQAIQCLPLMASDGRASLAAVDSHSSIGRAAFAGFAAGGLAVWAGSAGHLGPLVWMATMAFAGFSRITSWPLTAPTKPLDDMRVTIALLLQVFMIAALLPMPLLDLGAASVGAEESVGDAMRGWADFANTIGAAGAQSSLYGAI